MNPAVLKTYRFLRSLGLPDLVFRKIRISADGKPVFTRLSDPEFDEIVYPKMRAAIPERFWTGPKIAPETDLHERLPSDLHGMKISDTTH